MKKVEILILLLCSFLLNTAAQKTATVESFQQTTDHISANDRRNDFNGVSCALVKVQVVDDIERVEGNKIGDIVDKGVEKWVYMCKDSRNIRIHLKNHLPVRVMFQDYNINGLESNRVYELVINTHNNGMTSKEIKMQKLILNYTPANATVIIDTKMYSGNGRIEVNLPIGEHKYLIAANNYYTVEGSVKLNENVPRMITEELIADNTVEETTQSNQQTAQIGSIQEPEHSSANFDGKRKDFTVNGVSFSMIPVEGGTYVMGKPNPKAVRKVELNNFYIGEMEVTQELWMAVMYNNPSPKIKLKNPVVNVSWVDCQEFMNKLSQLTGVQFRFPTEAEWEFAARGGNLSKNSKDIEEDDDELLNVYDGIISEVGKNKPNELGIYYMCGNVGEWCQDWAEKLGYGMFINPVGSNNGQCRVVRGMYKHGFNNLWERFFLEPIKKKSNIGLRIAL